jgi:hypothetical protein
MRIGNIYALLSKDENPGMNEERAYIPSPGVDIVPLE